MGGGSISDPPFSCHREDLCCLNSIFLRRISWNHHRSLTLLFLSPFKFCENFENSIDILSCRKGGVCIIFHSLCSTFRLSSLRLSFEFFLTEQGFLFISTSFIPPEHDVSSKNFSKFSTHFSIILKNFKKCPFSSSFPN